MQIRYTTLATSDIRTAFRYIARDAGEATALSILARVRGSIASLADFSEQGKTGRVKSTRELVVLQTPFIAVYRIKDGEVHILAVIHGARRWPDTF
jgi:addiction module RelE/StbE family toxin